LYVSQSGIAECDAITTKQFTIPHNPPPRPAVKVSKKKDHNLQITRVVADKKNLELINSIRDNPI
jgi:hypothetical protein